MEAPNIGKTNSKLRGKCHVLNDVCLGLEINVDTFHNASITSRLINCEWVCSSPFFSAALLTAFFEILNCAIVSAKHNIII